MKKWTGLILFVVLLLAGCAGGAGDLAEGFEEDDVRQKSEEVVLLLNAKDTEGLQALLTETMKQALDEASINQVYAMIDEAGAYDSIEDMSVAGTTNQENNEELAVAAVRAKYELKNITYTLSFTKQMKLAGLFLK